MLAVVHTVLPRAHGPARHPPRLRTVCSRIAPTTARGTHMHTSRPSWLRVAAGTSWTLNNDTSSPFPFCTLLTGCVGAPGNCTLGQLTPPPAPPAPPPKPAGGLSWNFVGTWRGMHKMSSGGNSSGSLGNAIGDCGCALLSRWWIITAEHCAERVLKHEKVDVKINFHGDSPHVERSVTHCVRANNDEDVAICRLTAAVNAFPPVNANPQVYKTGHGATSVYTVGTMGGLHVVGPKRLEYEASGAHLYVAKGGGMKAGDSGGPWVQQVGGHHYLVGTLHGSGIAGQIAHIRAFLDRHASGINWVKP